MVTTATKKSLKRKAVKKTSASKQAVPSLTSGKKFLFKKASKKNFILIAAVVILGVLIYMFRGIFIAATVNGQVIPRWVLNQEIEKQVGEKTLNGLITRTLILQEMKKEGITISQEEVHSEIKKIEDELKKQGRTLEEAIAIEGITREGLIERLQIQKMIEKKFGKDAVVTDEEVKKYLTDNAEILPTDTETETLRSSVLEQLRQQKLTERFQAWLQEVQKKATVNKFVSF